MAKVPSPLSDGRKKAGASCPAPVFHQVFPATLQEVRHVLIDLRQSFRSKVGKNTLGRAELVLAEVLNNIVKHGHTGEGAPADTAPLIVHLSITPYNGGLSCAILDNGAILPPECLSSPRVLGDIENHDLPEGGFGWLLIRDLTQKLCYYRESARNILAMTIVDPSDDPQV